MTSHGLARVSRPHEVFGRELGNVIARQVSTSGAEAVSPCRCKTLDSRQVCHMGDDV